MLASANCAADLGGAPSAAATAAPADNLSEALEVMQRHFFASQEATTSGLAALSSVVDCARRVTKFAPYFQHAERSFGMLAISLRLEHGRSAGRSGFDAVSADIIRLGTIVGERFRIIFDRAIALHRTATSTRADQGELLKRQSRQMADLMRDAQASLGSLSELHASNEGIRRQAAESSQRISQATTDILVHLQAHDITRQMIEHVIEALSAGAHRTAPCTPACRGAHGATLGDLSTLCRIQAGQVESARRTLSHAGTQIASNLRRVSADVAKIAEQTAKVTDRGKLLESVEQRLAGLAEALRLQVSYERDTLGAVARVVDASTAMGVFVGEIGGLAHELKLVALNAFVKAVKVRAGGAVFSVLAQAIKDMSVDVTANTDQLTSVMASIAESGYALQQDGARDNDDIERIEARVRQLTEVIRQHEQNIATSIQAMRTGSSTIASEVDELTAQLASHAAATDALADIEHALLALADTTAEFEPRNGHTKREPHLREVANLYTMEAERRVHRRVADATDAAPEEPAAANAPEGNIEFF